MGHVQARLGGNENKGRRGHLGWRRTRPAQRRRDDRDRVRAQPGTPHFLSVLAVTGGALVAVVVEEMLTEAHEGDTSRLGPVFLTAGFALFAATARYFGS